MDRTVLLRGQHRGAVGLCQALVDLPLFSYVLAEPATNRRGVAVGTISIVVLSSTATIVINDAEFARLKPV